MLPYDRWEGYAAERNEILNFISNNGIDNVVFLTTDTHATLAERGVHGHVHGLRRPIANELVTGPIATDTFQKEVIAVGGPAGCSRVNTV